ncbi:MAG: hypothetical protein M3N95_09640 [Actinomycetota bacterium]|nr:hypothetical protein [Actinomycetota bacterium]
MDFGVEPIKANAVDNPEVGINRLNHSIAIVSGTPASTGELHVPAAPTAEPHQLDTDRALIDRVRAGDQAAEQMLYRMYLSPALRRARILGAQPADAEDYVAEAFLRVLRCLRGGAARTACSRPTCSRLYAIWSPITIAAYGRANCLPTRSVYRSTSARRDPVLRTKSRPGCRYGQP